MTTETASSDTGADAGRRLQCLEVWGGNRFVSTAVTLPGLDAWVYSMPADGEASVGGGDVHYASSCATGTLSRLLIADVSGHGADASETARRLRKIMQRHVNYHTQTRFVRALNAEFAGMARAGRFATAVAFSYDAPINRLLVCNAGHPPPLHWHASRRDWSLLEEPDAAALERTRDNVPLGIEDEVAYEQFEAPIEVGDLVLCYTDALIEARRRDGSMLDAAGVLEVIRKLDVSHPMKLIPSLLTALADEGCSIDDDLTLLLFRPNGTRPKVPLRDYLLVPLRFLRSLVRSV